MTNIKLNNITNKLFTGFISIVAVLVMAACSSDDDPETVTEMNSKEKAEFIKSQILDEKGGIDFYQSSNSADIYLMPVETSEVAHGLAETLSCTDAWDGNAKTVDLGDGYGTVRLMPGDEEGVFCAMVFNVKEIPHFTLEFASVEYCKNENASPSQIGHFGYYSCKGCGKSYNACPEKCVKCGGTSFKYV